MPVSRTLVKYLLSLLSMRYTSILLLLAILLEFGCKKYDEGPLMSMRSKKERLANDWIRSESYLNGVLSTPSDLVIKSQEFKKDGEYILHLNDDRNGSTLINGDTVETQEIFGTWEFYDSKEYIIMTTPQYAWGSLGSLGNDLVGDTVKIVRLKEKELWVSKDYGVFVFEDHYVPN